MVNTDLAYTDHASAKRQDAGNPWLTILTDPDIPARGDLPRPIPGSQRSSLFSSGMTSSVIGNSWRRQEHEDVRILSPRAFREFLGS
jgi:hypothetical protein